jgi:hypothetical protein
MIEWHEPLYELTIYLPADTVWIIVWLVGIAGGWLVIREVIRLARTG